MSDVDGASQHDDVIDVSAAEKAEPTAAVPVRALAEVLVAAAVQTSRALETGEEVDLEAELLCWAALFETDHTRAMGLLGEIVDLGADILADRIAATFGVEPHANP